MARISYVARAKSGQRSVFRAAPVNVKLIQYLARRRADPSRRCTALDSRHPREGHRGVGWRSRPVVGRSPDHRPGRGADAGRGEARLEPGNSPHHRRTAPGVRGARLRDLDGGGAARHVRAPGGSAGPRRGSRARDPAATGRRPRRGRVPGGRLHEPRGETSEGLQAMLERWASEVSADGFAENVSSKGVKAWAVRYEEAVRHQDVLVGRLRRIVSELASL